jgi:hypothetical protein
MNKLENFIYLSICEISLPMVKATQYSIYTYYCKGMYDSLIDGNLSYREKSDLLVIANYLEYIYALNNVEIGKYILSYFENERYFELQKVVMLTNEYFPFIGDWDNWFKK